MNGEYKLKVVVVRDGLFATAFWAKWDDGHIYYGTGHAEVESEYLRTSYHVDGNNHTHVFAGSQDHVRDIHRRMATPHEFQGAAKQWSKVLTPDLHELVWKSSAPKANNRNAILKVAAEDLPSWPLGVLNFWLVEHGRDDLVQEVLSRSILRDTFAVMANTQPQMLAFFGAPTEEEISGVMFAMRQGPSR